MAIHTTAYVAQRQFGDKFSYCYHSLVSATEAKERALAIGSQVDRVVEMPAIVFENGDVIEATLVHYRSDDDGIDRKVGSTPVRGTVRVKTLANSKNIFGEATVVASLDHPYVALHSVAINGQCSVLTDVRVVA